MLPGIFEPERVDHIKYVSRENAIKHSQLLAQKEGIFAGMSSGGAFAIALNIVEEINEGIVVFIVCDRGDRYLSSDLYETKT